MRWKNDPASLNHRLNRWQIKCSRVVEKPQDADQHQNRSEHRVQNKFDGRVDSALVSPNSNQEIHGDQHHFPEKEKQEQVQRNKNADYSSFQYKQANEKSFHSLADGFPRR